MKINLSKPLLCALLVGSSTTAPSGARETQIIEVHPAGVYATINTAGDIKMMKILTQGSPTAKANGIKTVLQSPTKFSPGALFALSAALAETGKSSEAMFWFLVADIRARYDAKRCADDSARPGASILRAQFGEYVYPYMRKNTDKLDAAIDLALRWDASHPYDYDIRWINFHGLKAMTAMSDPKNGPELSLPKAEWPRIREEVRSNFKTEYKNSIAALRGKPSAPEANTKNSDDELMKACTNGDTTAAERALKQGANPKFSESGYTPLHAAARAGSLPICKLLAAKGADVNASCQGATPLHLAASQCHPEVIEFLLKSKANAKVRDSDGMTALLRVLNNYKRSDVKTSTTSEENAISAIKMLLKAGTDPNLGATFFGAPLTLAAQKKGEAAIVRVLLDGGARVNEIQDGSTPLHSAVYSGDLEIVKLLVARGANVNATDERKQTPLAIASKNKTSSEIKNYLIEHGAK